MNRLTPDLNNRYTNSKAYLLVIVLFILLVILLLYMFR